MEATNTDESTTHENLTTSISPLRDTEIPEKSLDKLWINNNNIPRSSSLNEDSKLVKFTLPANSMSLIQSNGPLLLNKSRDFFNFITEKSTNMMEKALLPQNYAVQHTTNTTNIAMPLSDSDITSITNNSTDNNQEKIKHIEDLSMGNNLLINDSLNEQNLLIKFECLKAEKNQLEVRLKQIEERNKQLELDNSTGEIENREKIVERLTNELRIAISVQESLRKQYTTVMNDRETMVMKYAVSEKQLIDTQKAKDIAERKFKDITKENELLQTKIKQSQGERTRICGILDTKCRELIETQKELEKVKEDVDMREIKLKWTQTKLKNEFELHKETQQTLDKANQKINEMKDMCDQVRRESNDTIRKFQQSEENKAVTLDQQLKEQQAKLILERHVTEDKEILRIQLQKEVETLKNRQDTLINENNDLLVKIGDLEKNQIPYEKNLNYFKTLAENNAKEINYLNSQVVELKILQEQKIENEKDLINMKNKLNELQIINKQLCEDMEYCQGREAYSLDYTQKLTETNVKLQSEFTTLEAKVKELEKEHVPLKETIVRLKTKIKGLEAHLLMEKTKRIEECELLAKHVAEQTQLAQNLERKLEDSQGEMTVIRRKHQASIKELTRELLQSRKIIDGYEAETSKNSLHSTSRSASNPILHAGNDNTNT